MDKDKTSLGSVDVSETFDAPNKGDKLPDNVVVVESSKKKEPHDYKRHEFKPKEHKRKDSANFFLKHYDKNYKKLLILPTLTFIVAIAILLVSFANTGEFFQKDVSIKGGVTLTILQTYDNIPELESFLANSLGTTVNHYMSAQKEFGKIDKDVARITGSSMEVETLALDRPEREE